MNLKKSIFSLIISSLLFLAFASVSYADSTEEVCGFELPQDKNYASEIISVRNKLKVDSNEIFKVKVFLKNSGNMPWFAEGSKCLGPKMYLGTTKEKDRASSLYEYGLEGWAGDNRIKLDQKRVNPGQIGSFTFEAKAGEEGNVYKEFFAPVLKEITWLDENEFNIFTIVGKQADNAQDLRKKMDYHVNSGIVNSLDLDADKSLLVDLSEQQLYVKLGNDVVRTFRVSTGAYDTPTPVGETKISLKQEVRVGHKPPHYIMPKFQWFRSGGYGFHALPSLGRAHSGVFWTEARNHIGIPVSHGCIRLLPEDATWLFDYTEIGTTVVVQK